MEAKSILKTSGAPTARSMAKSLAIHVFVLAVLVVMPAQALFRSEPPNKELDIVFYRPPEIAVNSRAVSRPMPRGTSEAGSPPGAPAPALKPKSNAPAGPDLAGKAELPPGPEMGFRLRFQRGCRRPWWGPGLTRPSRHRTRNGSRVDRDLRWTIKDDVEFFVEGLAAKQRLSRYDHQHGQHEDMDREALRHAAGRRSPGCFENALCFHGCHQATTSIGRDKFDLQILNARFREINDAQNPLVVQA